MKNLPVIDILLPTYNGEQFLQAQLQSITKQNNVKTTLWVRDDTSTDATNSILHKFSHIHDVEIIPSMQRLGVVGNVNALMEHSQLHGSGKYFALADQDDIWHENKLATQYAIMQKLETQYGKETPLLIYSDARCVNAQGQLIHPSFIQCQGIPYTWGEKLQEALILSPVLGCSCMGNAALRRMALPIPKAQDIFMHDWWLFLVAKCFGATHCVNDTLLDYRQHAQNVFGVRKHVPLREKLRILPQNIYKTQKQAAIFLEQYATQLSKIHHNTIHTWATMPASPYFLRRYLCWRNGFGKPKFRWFIT